MKLKIFNKNRATGGEVLFIHQVLKGVGQIMLQENRLTGLLFLTGIFLGSTAMGFAALLATACGTITARLLKFDKQATDSGLYGFSAALTGVALMLLFKSHLLIWAFIVAGSAAAAILQNFFMKKDLPVFTFPFVLVTWIVFFSGKYFFPHIQAKFTEQAVSISDYFTFGIKGFGQVIFQGSVISGLLFFIAVFISSPVAALYGLTASVLSGILALHLSVPATEVSMGLFGFNAVLCAIAFAGNTIKDSIWVIASVLISLGFSLLLTKNNIPQLTFPFVAASFITELTRRKVKLRFPASDW